MRYPRKPACFKSAYQVEETRRKAITAAYQTLFQEVNNENQKLRKTVQKLSYENYMHERTILNLEVEIERINDRRIQP